MYTTAFIVSYALIISNCANSAAYFTMKDVKVTIPLVHGWLPPEKQPLITFHASTRPSIYGMEQGKEFLEVSRTSGHVFLKQRFFQMDKSNLSEMSASISVKDTIASQDHTSITVELSQFHSAPLNCDFLINDLCYWKSVRYRIPENTASTLIGTFSSSYLLEMCPGYKLNYTIVNANEKFRLAKDNNLWAIYTARKMDREECPSEILTILCTVENNEGTSRNVTRTFNVDIIDTNDNAARAQESDISVDLPSNVVHKDQMIEPKDLIFDDADSPEVNQYAATIIDDPLKMFVPNPTCTKHENDRTNISRTAIHCKLKVARNIKVDNWTYSIIVQLNDTTFIKPNEQVATVAIHLRFYNESGYHPSQMKMRKNTKPLEIYPDERVKVFRTATTFARITQPKTHFSRTAKNFTTEGDIFNVTRVGGILFVQDAAKLRRAPEAVSVNISWKMHSKTDYDEITVHIVDEPTKTCEKNRLVQAWTACAEYPTKNKCEHPKACAMGTGGTANVNKRNRPSRCMWRGENISTQITTEYSTCTPDIDTCPDTICDPLEELDEKICPQDCTAQVFPPTEKNKETGRGIRKASGVCTCTHMGCLCNPFAPPDFQENTTAKGKSQGKTLTATKTVKATLNSGNNTGKSVVLGNCDTSCVLGIVAGVLFLVGAVALIVICWRLDRVHKKVRGKFNEDHPDFTAPLSDYVDRTLPDPLPLNFDMSTTLSNSAVLNILNKYSVDHKWEFPRTQLLIEQTLGEGEFGRVLKAQATNIAGQKGQTTVAVKTLKDDAREQEHNDLLSEYQLLKEVSHPNVIRLLGVCTAPGGPIYLIIEFAEHGSLRNYLRRSRHLKSDSLRLQNSIPIDGNQEEEAHYDEPNISKVTPKEIISFAWQISKGMAYLSGIKLVHRDLAARNVLLTAEKICKISDFGLTRDIYEDNAYFKRSKGRVPVKWMAPESLSDHIYTNKSDVWSFGILIWELVSLGATPYPGIAVQNLFHLLRQGYRMERPDNCSPILYSIMRNCWHIEPDQRPNFQQLSAQFEKMLSDQVDYLDLANNAIHNRTYFCDQMDEIPAEEPKPEINPVNYLSKSQSYIKCGSSDKFGADGPNVWDTNQNTQGYETPVKVTHKVQTPTNDCPQYYTDMAAGKAH